MTTDDNPEIQFGVFLLQHILQSHNARPLDDRQAEALARYINELQGKLDDANDKSDELQARIDYMEQHPKGCRCRECAIP